ncbi:MAG TPA: CBS domain-containing protein [Devosia sp.]
MLVSELMTRDVRVASPDDSLQRAAKMMGEIDAGVLPVGENDRLVGMITDRDIAIRAVAKGMGPESKVRDVMSKEVKYCFEDEDLDDVTDNMGDLQLRRMPVLNRDKRLVGIISLGDVAVGHVTDAGQALQGISEPGGQHSQTG